MKNYYKVLQVDPSAEKEVIDAAFRSLMKKYHPDMMQTNDSATEEMVRNIIEAYQTLSNEMERLNYDRMLREYQFTQRKPKGFDENKLISRSMTAKCSVTKRKYEINIIKPSNSSGPYIISSFTYNDQEETNSDNRVFHSGLFSIIKLSRALILRENAITSDLSIGDIEWSGVKCPDCHIAISMKPGSQSSYFVCSNCHKLSCVGNAVNGIAGYNILCPWCGKNRVILKVVKTGEKGGQKITSRDSEVKTENQKLLESRKLLPRK